MQQLETAEHQDWVKTAIEKEKMKQRHLQVVIQHLESEVSNLSMETIRQMEESMMQVRGGCELAIGSKSKQFWSRDVMIYFYF